MVNEKSGRRLEGSQQEATSKKVSLRVLVLLCCVLSLSPLCALGLLLLGATVCATRTGCMLHALSAMLCLHSTSAARRAGRSACTSGLRAALSKGAHRVAQTLLPAAGASLSPHMQRRSYLGSRPCLDVPLPGPEPLPLLAEATSDSVLDACCKMSVQRIRSSTLRTAEGEPYVKLTGVRRNLPPEIRKRFTLKHLRSRPDVFRVFKEGTGTGNWFAAVRSDWSVVEGADAVFESLTSFSLPPVHISHDLFELESLLTTHVQPGAVLGFDIEFRAEEPLLIQLATPLCVILIHVAHLDHLPEALLTLLDDANTILLGVNVAEDMRKTALRAGRDVFAARLIDVSFASQRSGLMPVEKASWRPNSLGLAFLGDVSVWRSGA